LIISQANYSLKEIKLWAGYHGILAERMLVCEILSDNGVKSDMRLAYPWNAPCCDSGSILQKGRRINNTALLT
jgi:hypothetical protein